AGLTLTLEAGVILKMAPGTQFSVDGTLISQGSSDAPVYITSQADDSIGGDTAGDGPTSGARGQWNLLQFRNSTSATQLSNTIIRFGQQITLTNASPQFNNVTISSMSGTALVADINSLPTGGGNAAFGSALNGIDKPAGTVAQNQTWSLSGIPYVI